MPLTDEFLAMLDKTEEALLARRKEHHDYCCSPSLAIRPNTRSLAAHRFSIGLMLAPHEKAMKKIDRALDAVQHMRDHAFLLDVGATPDQLMRHAWGIEELDSKERMTEQNNKARIGAAKITKSGLDNIATAILIAANISAASTKTAARIRMGHV